MPLDLFPIQKCQGKGNLKKRLFQIIAENKMTLKYRLLFLILKLESILRGNNNIHGQTINKQWTV